jgi:hypothetical protein
MSNIIAGAFSRVPMRPYVQPAVRTAAPGVGIGSGGISQALRLDNGKAGPRPNQAVTRNRRAGLRPRWQVVMSETVGDQRHV